MHTARWMLATAIRVFDEVGLYRKTVPARQVVRHSKSPPLDWQPDVIDACVNTDKPLASQYRRAHRATLIDELEDG